MNITKPTAYDVGNLSFELGQVQKREYMYKQTVKTLHSFHSKRPHTIIKINDNMNMDSTIAGSMNDNMNIDSTITVSINDNMNIDSTIAGSINAPS